MRILCSTAVWCNRNVWNRFVHIWALYAITSKWYEAFAKATISICCPTVAKWSANWNHSQRIEPAIFTSRPANAIRILPKLYRINKEFFSAEFQYLCPLRHCRVELFECRLRYVVKSSSMIQLLKQNTHKVTSNVNYWCATRHSGVTVRSMPYVPCRWNNILLIWLRVVVKTFV